MFDVIIREMFLDDGVWEITDRFICTDKRKAILFAVRILNRRCNGNLFESFSSDDLFENNIHDPQIARTSVFIHEDAADADFRVWSASIVKVKEGN